ncbi:MAG: hypothetical protein Q9183_007823, partial [Haloplaca sp. 2 TL-2023]
PIVSSSPNHGPTMEAHYPANNILRFMSELTQSVAPPWPTFVYKILVSPHEVGDLSRDPLCLPRNPFDVVEDYFEIFQAGTVEAALKVLYERTEQTQDFAYLMKVDAYLLDPNSTMVIRDGAVQPFLQVLESAVPLGAFGGTVKVERDGRWSGAAAWHVGVQALRDDGWLQ